MRNNRDNEIFRDQALLQGGKRGGAYTNGSERQIKGGGVTFSD